jgi:hypothetical protein
MDPQAPSGLGSSTEEMVLSLTKPRRDFCQPQEKSQLLRKKGAQAEL